MSGLAYVDVVVGELDDLALTHDEVAADHGGAHGAHALASQEAAEDLLDFDDHGDLVVVARAQVEGLALVFGLPAATIRAAHFIFQI